MKFSIGIPGFKASYIKQCIDSILAQTIDDFELIVVNDASPENLDEVINSYSDSRIRYYKNDKNIGAEHVVDNWNICLAHSTGNYFVLMGDDDRIEHDYLEEFSKLITKYPDLDIYHCRSFIINENSEKIGLTPSWPEFESVYENIWHRMQGLRVQYISDFVYRTDVLKRNGGYYKLPLAWASDDISAYIAIGKKGIAHTNKPVFNYRQNSQTISSTGNFYLKMKAINMEKEWLMNFLNDQPSECLDKVFYINLKLGINKFIKKKKILTISRSYKKGLLSQFIFWITRRKAMDIKIIELLYSILEYFKQKKVENIY